MRLEFLLSDVTRTYFEGLAQKNEKAAHGYSRDSRPDCQQVCIGLVVTPEGLPIAYEVFAGHRADVTYPAGAARSITDTGNEYGRRSATVRQRTQAAWARTFCFALALAHAAGVNC